jgi:diguanylate cyclase (GGDEF)-like protein
MQESVRTYDAIGRYGGEEFLVVLPGADEEGVRMQAERMRHAIRSTAVQTSEAKLNVTCSFGCSAGVGGKVTAESLIRAADDALYRAKRAGRDRAILVPAIEHVGSAGGQLLAT